MWDRMGWAAGLFFFLFISVERMFGYKREKERVTEGNTILVGRNSIWETYNQGYYVKLDDGYPELHHGLVW